MPVSHREQGTANMNRKIQRGPRNKFFVVEITGVVARRTAGYPSDQWIRSHSDGTEKRSNLQTDSRRELRGPGTRIDTNEFDSDVWKLLGKRATGRTKTADAVWMKKLKALDFHFQGVAGLRAFNPNRTGEGMSAGTTLSHTLLDRLERARYFVFRKTCCPQPLQSTSDHRLHTDRVA